MSLFKKNGYCHELTKEAQKISFKIQIEKTVTAQEIEDIMVTALEGGIGYWACLLDDEPEFENKPKNIQTSQYAVELLLLGKTIKFQDAEDDEGEIWELTIEKLLAGIAQNTKERPHDCNIEDGDDITADCIVQYALFGEIVYG